MISKLRDFSKTKLAAVLVAIIIVPFVFWGMGSVFNSGNTNTIVKINKKNISTQDFMDHLNYSNISTQIIKDNLENNILEDVLGDLISKTLLEMEIKEMNLKISEESLAKEIRSNKNFLDENKKFSRTKYEKFLLSNNLSAPMFELQLKNRELQKHLFDFIGAGTITPNFLIDKKYEEN